MMMVIVRGAPNAACTERINAENPHEYFRQTGMCQDSMVLLIMVDDEQAQEKKAGQNAEPCPNPQGLCKDCPAEAANEQQEGGQHMPPTEEGRVLRVRSGGLDELLTVFHGPALSP